MTADPADSFATPRVAAGVLIRDRSGRLLLVKPTYKDGWQIPGGYVEHGESPRAAARREVKEELGVDLTVQELLVLDWAPHPNEGDKLLVIFDGGTVDASWIDGLVRQEDEVGTIAWHPVDTLADLMPDRLARRVAHAASANPVVYLEHGITD